MGFDAALLAQAQMPDPSVINGKALPAPELGNGVITVRVVRESVGNNLPGQTVTLTQGSVTRTSTTDAQGRAEFRELPPGSNWTAEATVEGEALKSDPFTVPSAGGLRVILVAGIAEANARKAAEEQKALEAPPIKGTIVLGEDSRVVMQFRSDDLQVFYDLQIVNNARQRVDIGGPLVIDLPKTAAGAGTLEGTTPNATINGTRLTVTGPFAPGITNVQIGYQLRYDSPDYVFEQKFPVALQQITVGVQKVGSVKASSPQFITTGDVRTNDGLLFMVGNGAALPAGGTLTVNLSGLPVHSRVPRYVALGLATAILGLGVWLSIGARTKAGDARQTLVSRRDGLLAELADLEKRRASGSVNAERYTSRRQRLVSELEQVYGELDDAGHGPQGGGEGIAA